MANSGSVFEATVAKWLAFCEEGKFKPELVENVGNAMDEASSILLPECLVPLSILAAMLVSAREDTSPAEDYDWQIAPLLMMRVLAAAKLLLDWERE